jgi:hypothetical protein
VAAALGLGAPLAAAPASPAGSGGAQWVPTPQVTRVTCVRNCAPRRRASHYSTLRISGSALTAVTHVVFLGVPGRSDDAAVPVRPASDRSVRVKVPSQAQSGPISLRAGERVRSRPTRPISILPPPPPEPSAELRPTSGPQSPGAPAIETGTSTGRFYLGSRGGIVFGYRVNDNGPVSVEIALVRAADGEVVHRWSPAAVEPGVEHNLAWNGTVDGAVQPEGRYAFRLTARGQAGEARSAQAADVTRDAFDFYDHVFPVRGRHDFGGAGARFGASRHGHSHQGHDVFARCGTRLVAARGGVVKFTRYHAAAGHYIVIDGDHTETDYAYMHLTSASPFGPGERVFTGQQIGTVGDSGNSHGCHLHFEMWSDPGWYEGGRPFDPLPHLTAWDAYS